MLPAPAQQRQPLLLVVHGHGGGLIPEVVQRLVDRLRHGRQAPVWIQALTAPPLILPATQRLLVVPLLLTPGSHVRCDLPVLRQRLRDQGHRVTMLPFLGAWGPWLAHLRQLAATAECEALLHHPLRPGVATRYLDALSRWLGIPLVSADQPEAGFSCALPLALAPNRMTAQQRALLERPQTHDLLFDLLRDLP